MDKICLYFLFNLGEYNIRTTINKIPETKSTNGNPLVISSIVVRLFTALYFSCFYSIDAGKNGE